MVGVFILVYRFLGGCFCFWKLFWFSEIIVFGEKRWGNMDGMKGVELSEVYLFFLIFIKFLVKGLVGRIVFFKVYCKISKYLCE